MKITPLVKLLLLLPLLAIATGCATVTRGSTDKLVVESTPAGADVKIYRTNSSFNAREIKGNVVADPKNPGAGPLLGTTPGVFKLARAGEYRIEISKQGFKTVEADIGSRLAGVGAAGMVGNAVFGGLVGVLVDSRSGATRDLAPNPLSVTLEQGQGTVSIPLKPSDASSEKTSGTATNSNKEPSAGGEPSANIEPSANKEPSASG